MNVGRNTAAASIHDHLYQSIHDDDGDYDGDHGDDNDLLCMHVCIFLRQNGRNTLTPLGRLLAVIPIAGDSPNHRKSRLP